EHFTKGGHGEAANSWVSQGPNRDMPEADLERAIGSETLDRIAQQTGLSRAAVLSRLSRELPSAIDRYSPEGRLPV
ncbi:YidB family protein, partial [Escherichia coli]